MSQLSQRVNGDISAEQVALIDNDGKRLGTYDLTEALSLAKDQGLDLVEINPSDVLPMCKITDKKKYAEDSARAYLNYLLTLNIQREESFGPLAWTFFKENNFQEIGLLPEEQFNLIMATVQSFSAEPKRYSAKLDLLKKAQGLLGQTRYHNPELARQLTFETKKTEKELNLYNEALNPKPIPKSIDKQQIIVQSDIPHYILGVAQKRAAEYFKEKYALTQEAKSAQHFSGGPRKFSPENEDVHKEFPGACGPFMNARTNAFHLMLPFDIKISRKPEDPLEAGLRIYYSKMGYSYPLSYENDKLCSFYDGKVTDISMDDENLLFFSVSKVKEKDFKFQGSDPNVPPPYSYPQAVLQRTGCLGNFLQIVSNFKVWFDASTISLLIQGAPDLYEYGLQGGSGLMTRSHGADKLEAYVENTKEPWQEGLSFNFVNIHLTLSPGTTSAFVPYNTPLFTIYPVLNQQNCKVESWTKMSG